MNRFAHPAAHGIRAGYGHASGHGSVDGHGSGFGDSYAEGGPGDDLKEMKWLNTWGYGRNGNNKWECGLLSVSGKPVHNGNGAGFASGYGNADGSGDGSGSQFGYGFG